MEHFIVGEDEQQDQLRGQSVLELMHTHNCHKSRLSYQTG